MVAGDMNNDRSYTMSPSEPPAEGDSAKGLDVMRQLATPMAPAQFADLVSHDPPLAVALLNSLGTASKLRRMVPPEYSAGFTHPDDITPNELSRFLLRLDAPLPPPAVGRESMADSDGIVEPSGAVGHPDEISYLIHAAHPILKMFQQYFDFVRRLRLTPVVVPAYLEAERGVATQIYEEAGNPRPSKDTLVRLGFRMAIDARKPIGGSISGYRVEYPEMLPVIRVYSTDYWKPRNPSDVVEEVHTFSPRAMPVLWVIDKFIDAPIDANASGYSELRDLIEGSYNGHPGTTDRPAAVDKLVSYRLDGGKPSVFVGGQGIGPIKRQDVSAVLTYFLQNPGEPLTGPQLKERLGKVVSNPSSAVQTLRKAFQRALPGAELWFTRNPYGWAPDVVVCHEPVDGR